MELRGNKVVVLRRHGPVSGTDFLKLDGAKHAVIWRGVKRNGCQSSVYRTTGVFQVPVGGHPYASSVRYRLCDQASQVC